MVNNNVNNLEISDSHSLFSSQNLSGSLHGSIGRSYYDKRNNAVLDKEDGSMNNRRLPPIVNKRDIEGLQFDDGEDDTHIYDEDMMYENLKKANYSADNFQKNQQK